MSANVLKNFREKGGGGFSLPGIISHERHELAQNKTVWKDIIIKAAASDSHIPQNTFQTTKHQQAEANTSRSLLERENQAKY